MRISFDDINAMSTQQAQGDGSLIAVLESIQARYRYLPPEALILVSERLGVPLAQAYRVAAFYNAFSLKPEGKHSPTSAWGPPVMCAAVPGCSIGCKPS